MISAVILTKNEEENIKECLATLKWGDEIVVIDDYSEDKTVTVAKKFGAEVYQRHLMSDFAAQRNFGLGKAKGEWVLFVDADERISPALHREIKYQVLSSKYQGFYLKRKDFFGQRWLKHGETANVKLLRLGRKGAGKWQRQVHETWEIKGKVGELKNPIFHYPHQTISDFLRQINFYSTLHAEVLFRSSRIPPGSVLADEANKKQSRGQIKPPASVLGEALYQDRFKSSLFRIIANPLGKFIQNWILRGGFLDGTPGLIVALMMSFHSFLARSKLYIKWKK